MRPSRHCKLIVIIGLRQNFLGDCSSDDTAPSRANSRRQNVDSAFLCTILWMGRKLGVSWSPLDEIRAITVPGLVIDQRIVVENEKKEAIQEWVYILSSISSPMTGGFTCILSRYLRL